ncbi:MAG: hypothetical protein ACLU38_05590 [Dysosmobacter sp.]
MSCGYVPAPTAAGCPESAAVAGLLPVRRLLLSPRNLRTPTGKIIIDENNWWQDFLLQSPSACSFHQRPRFTIGTPMTAI